MNGASFNMTNGSISNNTTGYYGGGVYVSPGNPSHKTVFTMSNGTISDNTADYYGGGVYLSDNTYSDNSIGTAEFEMTGGTITGNKANRDGGGVYHNGEKFTVCGTPKITGNTKDSGSANNVYLCKGTDGNSVKSIWIRDNGLFEGAKIGITSAVIPTTSSITIARFDMRDNDYRAFFESDNTDYKITYNSTLKLAPLHEHNWTYTVGDAPNTINAHCSAENCPITNGTITLNTPYNLIYSGAKKEAYVSVTNSGLTQPSVSYSGNSTDAGTYTASITLGGIKVSTTYTILPQTLTPNAAIAENRTYDGTTNVKITNVTFDEATFDNSNYTATGTIDNADVGSHNVEVTVALNSSNYTLSTNTITTTVDISKAAGKTFNRYIAQRFDKTGAITVAFNRSQLPNGQNWKFTGGSYSITPDTHTMQVDRYDVNADNGELTYQILNGAIGDEIIFPIVARCDNYGDYICNVIVGLTEKNVPEVAISDITTTYTGNPVSAELIKGTAVFEGKNVEGTWNFESEAPTAVKDSGTYIVVFTPTDSQTYGNVKKSIQITITKANPTGTPEYTKITESGKTLADAELKIGTIAPVGGTIAWNAGDETTVEANKSYGWTYTPADANNYEVLTGTITPYVVTHSSGSHSSGSSIPRYTVSVPSGTTGGTVKSNVSSAAKGSTVTVTVTPQDGYKLDKLTVADEKGNTITATDKGDNKYTFTMPSSKVTVTPSFSKIEETKPETSPFDDVTANDYFYDAVNWAAAKGITGGVSSSLFAPEDGCTRAQIVTFLWRTAGSPEPSALSSFADVPADAYYAKAVAWAVENSITNGTTDTTFGPDETCTRAHGVTFLYRAVKATASVGASAFTDVADSVYYADAVKWATEQGITKGISSTLFGPDETCTRAQIVTFLYRMYGSK